MQGSIAMVMYYRALLYNYMYTTLFIIIFFIATVYMYSKSLIDYFRLMIYYFLSL